MQTLFSLPAAFEIHQAPQAAANDSYGEVNVGGIKTACVTRDGLARIMLADCLAARQNEAEPKLVFASNGHAIAHDEYYSARVEHYEVRQQVKPGITGWAQVHGARGATLDVADMQRRIELDAWYVAHRSLWLDLVILARTPLEVLRRRNAV